LVDLIGETDLVGLAERDLRSDAFGAGMRAAHAAAGVA
jgi:hypothetical protein